MSDVILKNKPLVEAILEIRWELTSPAPNINVDPHFKLLLGRYFDRISKDYPEYEQLPAGMVPEELAAGRLPQHRFRSKKSLWPLIQLGPGLLTFNSTDDYIWSDFKSRSVNAVGALFDSHPKPSELKVTSLLLRYLDAVSFDFEKGNVLEFMQKKMQVDIHLPKELFADRVKPNPQHMSLNLTFASMKPGGNATLRFYNGNKGDTPVLIWETIFESSGKAVPEMPSDFEGWISQAHEVTHNWFFKLIEGDLFKEFGGE
jgi:uncharacterized protein (TIGR04255 family)